jgi:hypothetical protein
MHESARIQHYFNVRARSVVKLRYRVCFPEVSTLVLRYPDSIGLRKKYPTILSIDLACRIGNIRLQYPTAVGLL